MDITLIQKVQTFQNRVHRVRGQSQPTWIPRKNSNIAIVGPKEVGGKNNRPARSVIKLKNVIYRGG